MRINLIIGNMRKYSVVLAVVLPLLILVCIKTFRAGYFRSDAAKWAAPSVDQSNLISPEQLGSISPVLVIRLDSASGNTDMAGETISIAAETILEKQNQRRMRTFKGSIVLTAGDPALSARVWMLLTQMGYERLYILSAFTDNEVLKYKFRPDTMLRSEL
jgi:hypothetical protein